jgi:predicted PurR-regulated permease PerM
VTAEEPALPPTSTQKKVLIVLGAALVVCVAYMLKSVLIPLFFAFLLAYALDPLVDRLERLHVPRAVAAILLMAMLSAGAVTLLAWAVPYLIDEFRLAGDQLPGQLKALKDRADPWVWEVFHTNLPHTWGELGAKVMDELKAQSPDLVRGSVAALFGTLNVLLLAIGALIVPVFAVYLLIDFDRNVERAKLLVPRRFAPSVSSIAAEIHRTLGGYVRGQVTACIILSALYAVGLYASGLRLAIAIGVITGMLAFVPYIGFGTGFVLALTMSLLDWQGGSHVLATIGVMLGVQLLDATIVTPRVVGGSVGLKPLPVLLTMMAAGTLFGFVGVLLAVPLGGVVKILVRRAGGVYLASDLYNRPPADT